MKAQTAIGAGLAICGLLALAATQATNATVPIRFIEDARRAGLNFVLENHATPQKHQVEAMPGGVAVLDFDNDGFEDLYFVNGALVPGLEKAGPVH